MYDDEAMPPDKVDRIQALMDSPTPMTEERLRTLMEYDSLSPEERVAGIAQVFQIAKAAILIVDGSRMLDPEHDKCGYCHSRSAGVVADGHEPGCPWSGLMAAILGPDRTRQIASPPHRLAASPSP